MSAPPTDEWFTSEPLDVLRPPDVRAAAGLKREELDQIVDEVIDRIEQRVVEELERRGRRHEYGVI